MVCFDDWRTVFCAFLVLLRKSLLYLKDKKTSKSFYDSLRQFDLTGFSSDFRLFFRQRHFPFPKRRTRPAGGRNRERVSCSPQPGPVISSRREWRGSVCFQDGFSCTRPGRRGDSRFRRRPSGCRACLCSPRSIAKPALRRRYPPAWAASLTANGNSSRPL